MHLRPGILYAVPDLISLVETHGLVRNELLLTFRAMGEIETRLVLDTAISAGWISEDRDGALGITNRGNDLARISDRQLVLRLQLQDVVCNVKPKWAFPLLNGRQELERTAPRDVVQCFREAGILTGTDQDVIGCIDAMTSAMRGARAERSLENGRHGERLTVEIEESRTGEAPRWISIDSNAAGYDVLSVQEVGSRRRLRIEVKATTSKVDEASFYLTRNEWDTANASRSYVFHLWCFRGHPRLFSVPFHEVGNHVPVDQKQGVWQKVRIPFSPFSGFEVNVPDLPSIPTS